MQKVDEEFYRVGDLVDLLKSRRLEDQLPKRLWLRRLALLENLNNYYRFAVSSVRFFQESMEGAMDQLSAGAPTDDFDDKLHSSAIAFYSYCRVCLESSRLLSEEAILSSASEESANILQAHRDAHTSWAREIIDKRNAITAHPHERMRQFITGSPSSWGSGGRVRFNTIDLEHLTVPGKEYELEPTEDLIALKAYIEKTITHLRSIYQI